MLIALQFFFFFEKNCIKKIAKSTTRTMYQLKLNKCYNIITFLRLRLRNIYVETDFSILYPGRWADIFLCDVHVVLGGW
jgi:hypothetical protein